DPVHAAVLAAGDDQVVGQCDGGEERLLAFGGLEGPDNLALLPVDGVDLVGHGADVEHVAGQRAGRADLSAQIDRTDLLARLRVDDVQVAVAPGNEGEPARDRRRRLYRPAGDPELPALLAVLRQTDQLLAGRPEKDV